MESDLHSDASSGHEESSKKIVPAVELQSIKPKLRVTYNKKGVPIGDEATKLATFEGMVARTMVPITYETWRDVEKEKKEELWQYVQTNFVLDPSSRKFIIQSLGSKWKNFKHYLYKNHIKPFEDDPEAISLKPPSSYPSVTEEHWKVFISQRLSKNWQEKSKQGAKIRENHTFNHRLSRKGYAGLTLEIMEKTGVTEEEIDRALLWKKAREDKHGGYDPNVQPIVDKIEEMQKEKMQKSGSLEEETGGTSDVLTQALGTQERRGRVRGMGKYVRPHQYFYLPKNLKKIFDLENKKLDKRFNKIEADIQKLKSRVNNDSEGASCQVLDLKEDSPNEELHDTYYYLAVNAPSNIVAKGSVTNHSLLGENIEVLIETVIPGVEEALLPIPLKVVTKVKDAVGHIVSWPRHLVQNCSDLDKAMELMGKGAKLVKEYQLDNKRKSQQEPDLEEEENKEGKDIGKKEYELVYKRKNQREPDLEEEEKKEGKDLETKDEYELDSKRKKRKLKAWGPKRKSQRVADLEKEEKKEGNDKETKDEGKKQIRRTRLRVENNRVLKICARMVDKQLIKVENVKVQCEDDMFGFESYTYLDSQDFEAVFTMDEMTGSAITCYMMYLFEEIKNGPRKDYGICFVSPTSISPSGRMEKFKNSDEASRCIANRLSKRKGNDTILVPYNPGRHWVLAVIDMKTSTCYYLDSLKSSTINQQLKKFIDGAMVLYSKKRVKLNWVNVVVPKQPGDTECGYYVCKFMKEIVDKGLEVLIKPNIGDGKAHYTDADLDGIREDWADYVLNFVM